MNFCEKVHYFWHVDIKVNILRLMIFISENRETEVFNAWSFLLVCSIISIDIVFYSILCGKYKILTD